MDISNDAFDDMADRLADDIVTLNIRDSTDTVLVTFDTLVWSVSSPGTMVLTNAPLSVNASADGDADHFTLESSSAVLFTGTCGLVGSSPDMVLNDLAMVTGQPLTLTAVTLILEACV